MAAMKARSGADAAGGGGGGHANASLFARATDGCYLDKDMLAYAYVWMDVAAYVLFLVALLWLRLFEVSACVRACVRACLA